MALYPIFLELSGKKCVVVGGGKVASRKVARLLEAEADVTVVAPEVFPEIADLASRDRLRWLKREYSPDVLTDALLVFAATDSPDVNQRVAQDARDAGALVNVASGSGGDFLVPSIIRRGDLTIAIGTGGASPEVARKLRLMLEEEIGPEYAQWLELMGELREELKSLNLDDDTWQELWRHLAEIDVIQYLKRAQYRRARNVLWNEAARFIDAVERGKDGGVRDEGLEEEEQGSEKEIAVVLAAHGSTSSEAREEVERLAQAVQADTDHRTVAGYLSGEPSVIEAAESRIEEGASQLIIVPYLLSRGFHAHKDIPEMVAKLRKAHPDVRVLVSEPVGSHPLMKDIVVDRVRKIGRKDAETQRIDQ
jgi:precorrin-2 dehydrogenase/sirohydrochlorin ferrochelatase